MDLTTVTVTVPTERLPEFYTFISQLHTQPAPPLEKWSFDKYGYREFEKLYQKLNGIERLLIRDLDSHPDGLTVADEGRRAGLTDDDVMMQLDSITRKCTDAGYRSILMHNQDRWFLIPMISKLYAPHR